MFRFLAANDTGLVCWDHVLDVDERILPAVCLKELQGFLNQIAEAFAFALTVLNAISKIVIHIDVDVKDGQDLAVVGDKGLADHVTRFHEVLEDLQGVAHDLLVAGVEGLLDRDDQLRHDGEDLRATLVQEVAGATAGHEFGGVLGFTQTIEENGEVVVVIQLVNIDFPLQIIASAALELDWQVAAFVELAEVGGEFAVAVHG